MAGAPSRVGGSARDEDLQQGRWHADAEADAAGPSQRPRYALRYRAPEAPEVENFESRLAAAQQHKSKLQALTNPAWRHDLATELAARTGRLPAIDDPWVHRLCCYLRIQRDPRSLEALREVEDLYADIAWARQFHAAGHRSCRSQLEALVVAGDSVEDIAQYLHLPELVVQAYEALYYDVRLVAASRGALRSHIIARAATQNSCSLDLYWKTLALADRGSELLKALWTTGDLPESTLTLLDSAILAQGRRNALAAQYTRLSHGYRSAEVVEEYIQTRRMEIDAERAGPAAVQDTHDTPESFAESIFKSIHFTVRGVKPQSERGCIEFDGVTLQAPAILARLQAAAKAREHAPETDTPE